MRARRAGVPATTSSGARRPSSSAARSTARAVEVLVASADRLQHRARRRQVPDMRVAEQRGLGDAARRRAARGTRPSRGSAPCPGSVRRRRTWAFARPSRRTGRPAARCRCPSGGRAAPFHQATPSVALNISRCTARGPRPPRAARRAGCRRTRTRWEARRRTPRSRRWGRSPAQWRPSPGRNAPSSPTMPASGASGASAATSACSTSRSAGSHHAAIRLALRRDPAEMTERDRAGPDRDRFELGPLEAHPAEDRTAPAGCPARGRNLAPALALRGKNGDAPPPWPVPSCPPTTSGGSSSSSRSAPTSGTSARRCPIADIVAALYGGVLRIAGPRRSRARPLRPVQGARRARALRRAAPARAGSPREQLDTYCGDGSLLGVHPEHALAGHRLLAPARSARGCRSAPAPRSRPACRARRGASSCW